MLYQSIKQEEGQTRRGNTYRRKRSLCGVASLLVRERQVIGGALAADRRGDSGVDNAAPEASEAAEAGEAAHHGAEVRHSAQSTHSAHSAHSATGE